MAEKLSEASWNVFAKKRDLNDPALSKALGRLDKSDATQWEARLDALEEVVSQCKKSVVALAKRSKELGDKPFKEAKDKLYELLDEAEKQQKTVRTAMENDESPALITTSMLALLRDLRKGEARMPVLIALVGRRAAVMISRRAISASHRKMLAKAAGGDTAKYTIGECYFEGGALNFVIQGSASKLAVLVRIALSEQTGVRLKVKIRGDDGEESDGEDEESAGLASDADPGKRSEAKDALDAPGAPALAALGSPAALAWAQRLPDVQKRLAEALDTKHPQTALLRKLIEYATDKANNQLEHEAALNALDKIDQLLDVRDSFDPAGAAAARPMADLEASGRVAPAIVYTQTRLVWNAARGKVRGDLAKLEQAILSHYSGQPALPVIAQSVRKLDGILALFDESLSDALDAALNAASPIAKQDSHIQARAIIERYQHHLSTDPTVLELDDNPFVPLSVKATLDGVLSTLAAKIG